MAASKLVIADKKEILRLYCETDVSTTQLAQQFGVSSSTVLRLLQELIPPEEYRLIVSQKQAKAKKLGKSNADVSNDFTGDRIGQSESSAISVSEPTAIINQLDLIDPLSVTNLDIEQEMPARPSRSKVTKKVIKKSESTRFELEQKDLEDIAEEILGEHISGQVDDEDIANELAADAIVGEDFEDTDDSLEDDDDDDLDDDDLDDDDLDDDDRDEADSDSDLTFAGDRFNADPTYIIDILPLDEAHLPDTCYMVIDKSAEIITRPLKDFKELGKIPPEETNSRTVAIFDNHRIARRFSSHNQRVIKFPGDLIYITHDRLSRKGITRLLFDGRVFAL